MSHLAALLSSGETQSGTTPSRIFTIRKSPNDRDIRVVHPAGYGLDAPPLYSVKSSKSSKESTVLIFRGTANPPITIGDAQSSSGSSTIRLSIHGRQLTMKASSWSGHCSFECPPMGKLTWKLDKWTATSLELYNASGQKLAKIGKSSNGFSCSSDKKLEILVTSDDYFVELVLLSGMTAKLLLNAMVEEAAEVIGEIAGAA